MPRTVEDDHKDRLSLRWEKSESGGLRKLPGSSHGPISPPPDRHGMASNKNLPKIIAAGGAAAVLAAGAWLLGTSGSSASTTASTQGPPGMAQGSQPPSQSGQPPARGSGQMPPGFGDAVTGDTADRVAAAATAEYPGEVERIMQLADGSYVAHVITSSGEVHVAISKDFKVTGTEQGGPPVGGTPPSGSSTTPPSSGTTVPDATDATKS